jgi:RNA polymerase sigma-70 factor (ECF subfamily)
MTVTPQLKTQESTLLISNTEEEIRWLRGVANGDRTCFRKLHKRFGAIIFSTILKVLGNYEDSEDIKQEVFAKIWKKAYLYDASKGKPITWATTMARNRAIDHYRSRVRRSKSGERYISHIEVNSDLMGMDTEREVTSNETSGVLRSAVLELTPDQREAIELAYFGGMTQNEVAQRTGLALGTVKARIRRGLQRLERKVKGKV